MIVVCWNYFLSHITPGRRRHLDLIVPLSLIQNISAKCSLRGANWGCSGFYIGWSIFLFFFYFLSKSSEKNSTANNATTKTNQTQGTEDNRPEISFQWKNPSGNARIWIQFKPHFHFFLWYEMLKIILQLTYTIKHHIYILLIIMRTHVRSCTWCSEKQLSWL